MAKKAIDKKKMDKQKMMRGKKKKFDKFVKRTTGKGKTSPIAHKPLMVAGGAGIKA
jgi:hypothetical protein